MTNHIVFNSVNRINSLITDPANCEISLNKTIFVACAELAFFQCPNTFYNVTSANNTFLLNNVLTTIDIGCYSLNDLFTEILSVLPAGSTLEYSEVTNQTKITFLVATALDFSVSRFHLLLGFKKKSYIAATLFLSEHPPKIYQSNIFIQTNLANNTTNDLGFSSTFCLPITANRGEMIQFHNRTMYSSRLKMKGREIKNVTFILKDEYDQVLQGAGDFTLILSVLEDKK